MFFLWPIILFLSANVVIANTGSFTVDTSATLRFLQIYFYASSDGSGTALSNGVISFIDSNSGMSLSSGQTYSFDSSSIYSLANSRGISMSSINSMKVYMDSGNSGTWSGTTTWGVFGIDCHTTANQCTSTDSKAFSWGTPDTTTVTRYIYITENNSSSLPIYRCPIAGDGTLTCVQQTNGAGTNYSLGNFVHNGYLYQTQSSPSNIIRCVLDPSLTTADALASCTTLTTSNLSSPKGMAFSTSAAGGAYAYILNGSTSTGSITPCKVNADGTLTCSSAVSIGANDPRGIAIYQGTAFVTNNQDNTISTCSVSGSTITSCGALTISGPTLNRPRGIVIYNGYIYFINDSAGGSFGTGAVVESCALSSLSGSTIICVDATSGQNSTFGTNGPNGIVIYNGNAYLTDFSNKKVYMCSASNGILGTCSATATATTFSNPVGISVY